MIYSDDNIHTAIEKLAAVGLDKTADTQDMAKAVRDKKVKWAY